ncbi:MAG: hypothetical protein DRH50_11635 [Deltaproteobacteria bacterium]|nr:MAG: hypothetical protein DRH50_11635 [Deltaproteobacteria bacterium]
MREIIESGFKVIVPNETSFRLCENPVYRSLSGLGLKEMDIGWWDNAKSKLLFFELKGIDIWRQFDRKKDIAHAYLVKSLKGKVTDVLLMMAALWVGTDTGKAFKESLPDHVQKYHGDGSLKLIFLIDTPISRKSLLAPVKDAINKELAGRVRLFGVRHVTLVDFDTANRMGLPVTREG